MSTPNPESTTSTEPERMSGYAKFCVGLLTALGFSLGCSEFIIIGIQPEIAEAFHVSLAQTGVLMSMFSIVYAVLTPLLALTTGRFSRRTLLVTYCVLYCLGNGLSVLAVSFEMLLAARLLIGGVSGALLAVGTTFIPDVAGMNRISWCVSLMYAAFSVALVICTPVCHYIAAMWDWHLAMIGTFAMTVIVCSALVALLPRTGATDAPATARDQLPLLRDPRMLSGMAIFFFGVGSMYVFYGYITPYLEDFLGMSAVEASGTLMAYGAMCCISNLISGWGDTHFGLKTLLVSFSVQGLLLLALWAVGPTMPRALGVVLALGVTMYVVSTPCVSMFMTTAAEKYPQALTLASSLEPTSFNIGIAFGTAVGGMVISGPGMGYVGLVGALFSIPALIITALAVRISQR